ncbi:uncharacterized protein JCM10292_007412 [Rhodotorula paludigena]|uniref:uncharacterized protein n=1 Tax=Rhodotorula paludigena TaxID=86838 RepID=UPI00316B7593
MDPPRESVRDGVAPRHRPPLARGPDDSSLALDEAKARGEAPGARADAAPGVAAAGAPGAAAGSAQAKPNTRRRAGSLVKQPTGEPSTRGGGGAAGPPAKGVTPPPAGTRAGSPGAAAGSPAAAGAPTGKEAHNTRNAHSRRPPSSSSSAATTAQSAAAPAAPVHAAASAPVNYFMPANAPLGYRPATARPPLSRIPAFPLVDAYVPEANSSDRRHPRQLLPKDLGFPTTEMADRIHPDDLDDRLLMATCAVLHGFENRALCPKEVAEVMLERDWLKNAGTTPFAHVSTCIRSHVSRAAAAKPPYAPLLVPFELVGALTAEEVRAVGLHAEQRPAVKRGTLWYLNPQVLGAGVGADDPFVRCRREAGLAPSDRDGLYVRGLVPLQHTQPNMPPALGLSSSLFSNVIQEEGGDGDELGMGRGKRKRRASSAMMAAMGTSTPAAPSPLGSGASTPVAIPSPRAELPPVAPPAGSVHRRTQSFAGPASAPSRSSIPKLKLRLTSLDEVDSSVDSDGHTGEAAEWRKKNKKKVRRAGSEGLSRAGSVESDAFGDDDSASSSSAPRPSTYSSASSSALLAQSLLAASTPGGTMRPLDSIIPHATAISPDSLSLVNRGASFPFSRPSTVVSHLSVSAPNIFSHHFTNAPSPPDVIMDEVSSPSATADSRPGTSQGLSAANAVSPPSDSPDEDDFHEAMLRGDDFEFEWGSESYTTAGTSSIETSVGAAELARAFSQQAKKGKQRATSPLPPSHADDVSYDTPATTPRSPGKEVEADEGDAGEKASDATESVELVQGPLGTISRVGMSTTLCGEMTSATGDEQEDADVVIVSEVDGLPESAGSTNDPVLSANPLIDLAHEDPVVKDGLTAPHLAVPPPSPLPLDLSPSIALNNAYAGTDYDFVGHDEADLRSPFFRSSAFMHQRDADDLADDEDEEDDIVTVKIEEDDEPAMAVSSLPSSRASSAVPTFDSRVLAAVRAGSAGSSSSDSDGFDPMTFVSAPLLATGLPVPQPAPSPPETTDWAHGLDMLDDFDSENSGTVDLMAPEMIGLEELDLAWAGDDDDTGSPPAPTKPVSRAGLSLAVPRSASGAFLTGASYENSHRFTSPMPSPRRTSSSRVPLLSDLGKKATSKAPAPPTLTRTSSAASVFTTAASSASSSPTKASPSSVVMEPVIPLDPPVLATVVQRGVVVFSANVTDLATARTMPFLRRIDTDYCNATTLLQAALSSPLERASTIASLLVKADTVRVPGAADAGIEGTWVPLHVARDVVALFPKQLGHLVSFLSDELAGHFPEPIPTMRSGLQAALEQKALKDPNALVLGNPCFEGSELLRRCGPPGMARSTSSAASRGSSVVKKSSAPPPAVAAIIAADSSDEEDDGNEDEDETAEEDRRRSATPPPAASTRASKRRGSTAAVSTTPVTTATRSRRTGAPAAPTPVKAESPASPRRSSRRQSGVAK